MPPPPRPERGFRAWLTGTVWVVGFSLSFLASELVPLGFRDKWIGPVVLSTLLALSQIKRLMALWPYINRGMPIMLGWAVLSAAWAPSPMFVITQCVALIGVSMMAVAFSLAGWHPERFERDMVGTCMVILLASAIAGFVAPGFAIHSGTDISLANSWRGITGQKNFLGQLSSISLILWTHLWASRRVRGSTALAGAALTLFCVIKSRSSTSLMLALISSASVLMILRPPLPSPRVIRKFVLWTLIIVVPVVIYLAIATPYIGFVSSLFGKTGTFSGRKEIWDALMLEIQMRPWLGTGLASFWGDIDAGEARVRAAVGWGVRNGHNGYVDIVNELGLIGLFLFLIFLGYYCVALARLSRVSRSHYALHLPLFIYLLLANTSESGWFFLIAPTHLIGMYASLEISRLLLEDRKRRAAAHRAAQVAAMSRAAPAAAGPPSTARTPA